MERYCEDNKLCLYQTGSACINSCSRESPGIIHDLVMAASSIMNHDNNIPNGTDQHEIYEREQTAKKFNDVLNKHGITKR